MIPISEQVRILTNCDCSKGLKAPLLPPSLRPETQEEFNQRVLASDLLDPFNDLEPEEVEVTEEPLLPPSMRSADLKDEKQVVANQQSEFVHPATNSEHLELPVWNFAKNRQPAPQAKPQFQTIRNTGTMNTAETPLTPPKMDFKAYRQGK